MKIALVTCGFRYDDYYEIIANPIYENLGIEYIASLLREYGFYVDLYNQDLEIISREDMIYSLKYNNYSLIGFYTNFNNMKNTLAVIKRLPSDIHKCLGGYPASLFPQELINKNGVDSIISGEGEFPFLELAQALKNGQSLNNISNLVTKYKTNPMRCLVDINELPEPARDELYKKYGNMEYDSSCEESRWALVSSSRGCHYNCKFCYVNKFYRLAKGQKVRYRDPIKVVDEIEGLVKSSLKINSIWFVDEDFIGCNEERIRILAEEIIRRKIEVAIEIDCRPDSIKYDLFAFLKKAGLVNVFIGIESFSESFLRRLNKGVSVKQNIDALNILRELNINFILGNIFFDEDTDVLELYNSLNLYREYGFDKLNDPTRARKSYLSSCKIFHHIPKDKNAMKIYKTIKKESNNIFFNLANSNNVSLENIMKSKKEVGNRLYKFVQDKRLRG